MILTLGETLVCFTPEERGRLESVRRFRKSVGGAESNTAIGLSRLGRKTAWISRLGRDPFGDEIIRVLRGEGVDIQAVKRVPDAPTGIMIKELRAPDDVRVHYYRAGSAASQLSESDIDPCLVADASRVHLTGVTCALGEGPRRALRYLLELCREQSVSVSFDPNLRLKLWSAEKAASEMARIFPLVDTVLASEWELVACTRTEQIEDGIRRLQELGVDTVVVRRGHLGTVAVEDGSRVESEAAPVTAVDVVGAGDAFNAGFLFGRDQGHSLDHCVAVGNWSASQVVAHPGDWEGLPTANDYQAWRNSEKHVDR